MDSTPIPAFESAARSTLETLVTGKSNVKVVVAGDSGVGKSALVKTLVDHYCQETIPRPGGYEHEHKSLTLPSGNESHMEIVVVPGQKAHAPARKRLFQDADVVLICFSVADADEANPNDHPDGGFKASFCNAIDHWFKTAKDASPDAAIILVGTKADRRASAEDEGRPALSVPVIRYYKKETRALEYFEVSAKEAYRDGLHRMFAHVATLTQADKQKQKLCHIM